MLTRLLKPYLRPGSFSWLSVSGVLLLLLSYTGSSSGQALAEVPNAASLAEAKQMVEEVYSDLLDAQSNEDRALAARVLIMRAGESDSAPAAKYIMYETARSMAIEAGDTEAAMDAVNGLAASFNNETGGFLTLAANSLQTLVRKARSNTEYAAIASAGLEVADRMMAAGQLDEALELLTRLRSAAQRSRRTELSSNYRELLGELRMIQEVSRRIKDDAEAIELKPDDPELNLSVGKFQSLYLGDWENGLVQLAKCSDERLAEAAKADLAGAEGTTGQIAIGDRWWALATGYSGVESRRLTERAQYWYRQAIADATGIERSLLIKRLSPAGKVVWGDLVLEPGIRTVIEIDGDSDNAKPGPISKASRWEFEKKNGASKRITLHFEGYLYFPKATDLTLRTGANSCTIAVSVNRKLIVGGNGVSESPVRMLKGYNQVRGSITVLATYLENPKYSPVAKLSIIDASGNVLALAEDRWYHDATR